MESCNLLPDYVVPQYHCDNLKHCVIRIEPSRHLVKVLLLELNISKAYSFLYSVFVLQSMKSLAIKVMFCFKAPLFLFLHSFLLPYPFIFLGAHSSVVG
jgi:hypothetical protein